MLYFLGFDRSETGKAIRRLKKSIHDREAAKILLDYRLSLGQFASEGQAWVIWEICEKAHPAGAQASDEVIDQLWRGARFDAQSQEMRSI